MAGESKVDKSIHYTPPSSDFIGVTIALTILTAFLIVWYHALFQINVATASWLDFLGTFVILEFLYTGLFMTSHDAMHGVVSYHHRWLNNTIGYICFSAYAWFDYRMMYVKHWRHHNHTGVVTEDPDFHDGKSIGFFRWYCHFLWEYTSTKQSVKMVVFVYTLFLVFSVPMMNMIIYMLVCGLCSSLRMFYFGTYLPHRPTKLNGKYEETMPWEKSKSSNVCRLLSFLSCYHFDYHWEHHRWPYAPWWDLWKCKEISRKMNKS